MKWQPDTRTDRFRMQDVPTDGGGTSHQPGGEYDYPRHCGADATYEARLRAGTLPKGRR